MNKLGSILIGILLLSMVANLGGCDAYRTPNNMEENLEDTNSNALIILESIDVKSMQESRRYIEDKGGRITHIYPPHILIGYIPKDIARELVGEKEIAAIHYGLVDPLSVEKYGKTAVYAVEAWNNNFMGLANQKGLTPKPGALEPPPIKGDALVPPETKEPIKRNTD